MSDDDSSSIPHVKHTIIFEARADELSTDIAAIRKEERKAFEERKRKRKEARNANSRARIAREEENKIQAARERLNEERRRVEREIAEAVRRKKAAEDEERKKQLYQQQYHQTMTLLDSDFINAGTVIQDINEDWITNYEEIKNEWVRKNVSAAHLSEKQLAAIGDVSNTCLLRARAGSGKTTVLKQKIDLILRKTPIQPDEILALAFNRSAADEIKHKLQRDYGHLTFDTSLTFHALANRIVVPQSDVMRGEEKSSYVESFLRDEMNPSVRADIYEFFRREMAEIENLGSLLNKSDYYAMRREATNETLNGEHVKSIGEKWIADFLFEHNIRYGYERSWTVDAKNNVPRYHPDFSLAVNGRAPDVVIEHWGIDEFDRSRSVPSHWLSSWSDYYNGMQWKRKYWEEHNANKANTPVAFVETSIRDMRRGREWFEDKLSNKLRELNVPIRKLPKEVLEERIVRHHIPRLAKSIETFIGKAKKARKAPQDLERKLLVYDFKSKKEEIFVRLAVRMFRRYQDGLSANNRFDFDDVLSEAIDKIDEVKGAIFIRKDDHSEFDLREVKWIMIDEYQDFSKLFFDLVNVIRRYNPNVRLFCVGDNWQAINGFAGSDLKFFDKFSTYFNHARILDLPDNYRSQPNIVAQGNAFMSRRGGVPSVPKNHEFIARPIVKYHLNEVYIHYDGRDPDGEHEIYKTRIEKDGESRNADASFKIARCLMLCEQIITSYPLDTTRFMILSRTESLGYGYKQLEKFKKKLREVLKPDLDLFDNFDEQVQCTTVHKSKGLEADVVVILDADERRFPMIHPDNLLNRILDVNIDDVYLEEERLFYVALTRAKQDVCFITENGRTSEFLGRMEVQECSI